MKIRPKIHIIMVCKIHIIMVCKIHIIMVCKIHIIMVCKIHIIMVCKILIDGVMVVKLGKIVYVFTQHVHTAFEISTSFISQNIPVEMLFLFKKRRKFTLFWSVNYTSMELST